MTVAYRRQIKLIQMVAVGLLIIYGSITAAVDLLHNHNDLVERSDCPACLWLQMSQDSDPDVSPTNQVISDFNVIAFLPPPLEAGIFHSHDVSSHHQIRAPPTL